MGRRAGIPAGGLGALLFLGLIVWLVKTLWPLWAAMIVAYGIWKAFQPPIIGYVDTTPRRKDGYPDLRYNPTSAPIYADKHAAIGYQAVATVLRVVLSCWAWLDLQQKGLRRRYQERINKRQLQEQECQIRLASVANNNPFRAAGIDDVIVADEIGAVLEDEEDNGSVRCTE